MASWRVSECQSAFWKFWWPWCLRMIMSTTFFLQPSPLPHISTISLQKQARKGKHTQPTAALEDLIWETYQDKLISVAFICLVGGWATLWKIWKSVGVIIPNIWQNRKGSKPSISLLYSPLNTTFFLGEGLAIFFRSSFPVPGSSFGWATAGHGRCPSMTSWGELSGPPGGTPKIIHKPRGFSINQRYSGPSGDHLT